MSIGTDKPQETYPASHSPGGATQADGPLCMCKDRLLSKCPGEWEPGCDLGNNPAFVAVHKPDG